MSREDINARLLSGALAQARETLASRLKGRKGAVDALLAHHSSETSPSTGSGEQAKVLYEYHGDVGQEGGYLELQPGDVITVLARDASGWWKGQKGDRVGVFPGNYVQLLGEESAPRTAPSVATAAPPPPSPSAEDEAGRLTTLTKADLSKTPADLHADCSEIRKSYADLLPEIEKSKEQLAAKRREQVEAVASLGDKQISFAAYDVPPIRAAHYLTLRLLAMIEEEDTVGQTVAQGDALVNEIQNFLPALNAQVKEHHSLKAVKAKLEPLCTELQQKLLTLRANSDSTHSLREFQPNSLYDHLSQIAAALEESMSASS